MMIKGEELGKAVSTALDKKNYRGVKADLARALGVKPPSLYDLIDYGRISKDNLSKLWKFFEDVCGPEHWGLERFPWGDADSIMVPLVDSKLSAGSGSIVLSTDANQSLHFREDYLLRRGGRSGQFALFKINGDSMIDVGIMPDSIVLVDMHQSHPVNNGIFGFWMGNEFWAKELIKHPDGTWCAVSHNKDKNYPDIEIKTEDSGIIGRILWCAFDI